MVDGDSLLKPATPLLEMAMSVVLVQVISDPR
jgi:hypothetical protein